MLVKMVQGLSVWFCLYTLVFASSGVTSHNESMLENWKSNVTSELFVDYIFKKYSNKDFVTLEGFEHLLQNLHLGDLYFDHNFDKHMVNSKEFMTLHSNHDHKAANGIHGQDHLGNSHHGHDHRDSSHQGHDHLGDENKNHDHTGSNHNENHKHEDGLSHDHPDNTNHRHVHDGPTEKHKSHQNNENGEDLSDDHNQEHSKDQDDTYDSYYHRYDDFYHDYDSDYDYDGRKKRSFEKRHADGNPVFQECLAPLELLKLFKFGEDGLKKAQFIEICPALIVQLDSHTCSHAYKHCGHNHGHENEDIISTGNSNTKEIWLFACAAIVVISVSGMIAVGILSVLHKIFVESFLQFLVAMAVGALTGDAMLHLIPHTFQSGHGHNHGHSHDGEGGGHGTDEVLKGLAGLAAFYVFFLIGRIQAIISIRKTKTKTLDTEMESVDVTMVIKCPNEEGNYMLERVVESKPKETEEIKGHNSGHSHGHSHDDDVPQTTGAMVWRVIVGDGIHNFSDGLAIGVAFTASITSGISTAIAVLCHELPHEVGDFAVLLRKGMSIRRALGFNCLSSVLSMIGVLTGVAMGNLTGVKDYILVCVAGMFIYISLVDMLPEISSTPAKNPVRHLLYHILGICIGCSIMLAIALKEEDLMNILDS